MTGPINNMDDARAKLQAIRLMFLDDASERSDGAERAALAQVIDWMEAFSDAPA